MRRDTATRAAAALERLAPLAGLAAVALFVGGFAVPGADPEGKRGAALAAFYHEHRAALLVGNYVTGIALVLFLLWAWDLRRLMPEAGLDEWVALFCAMTAVVAVELGEIAASTTLAHLSSRAVPGGTADALNALALVFSYVDWFPTAFFWLVLARAVLGGRTLLPRVLGWGALALVGLSLVAAPRELGLDVPISLAELAFTATVSVVGYRRLVAAPARAEGRSRARPVRARRRFPARPT